MVVFVARDLALAWGVEGHTYVNHLAARKIAGMVPRFLSRASDRIVYAGLEPDRNWRSTSEPFLKNAQEPDHFIDMERLEGLGELPVGRYEFYRRLYERRAASGHGHELLPENVGLQPYITMEIYERLKAAFRDYRGLKKGRQPTRAVEQNIVFYAGWLGHYVADGAQPLHTTIHYNGWVGPNPNGYSTSDKVHWDFESAFVARNVREQDFAARVGRPVRLAHPFLDYLKFLKESHGLVERFYQIEKTGGFAGGGSPAALEFTRERLAAATQMLINLWYTAWLESGEAQPPSG